MVKRFLKLHLTLFIAEKSLSASQLEAGNTAMRTKIQDIKGNRTSGHGLSTIFTVITKFILQLMIFII